MIKKSLSLGLLITLSSYTQFATAVSTPVMHKQVSSSAKVKISKAIKDLAPLQKITPQRKIKLTTSGMPVPGVDIIKEVPNKFPFTNKLNQSDIGKIVKDPVLQSSFPQSKHAVQAPEIGASFDGMTNPQGYVPPDTNGSVGPNHYVQTVNVSLAIWDKMGNELVAPVALNSLWADFGGICQNNNNGDPIVMYDRRADRWLISQFALADADNHQCIAISQTGDPTGSYFLYDFPYGELMNDYPHFGIFGDAYYMGVNQFTPGSFNWAGGGMAAYERDKMLVGAEAQQVVISGQTLSTVPFTPMPLDVDGLVQPPVNMNQLFVWADGDGASKLHVWQMALDWSDAAATTFTPVTELEVAEYAWPNNATQPNGEELDALGVRSMFRTSYRNINGDGKILFTHNVSGPNGQPVARWYQLDVDHANGNAVTVNQQGTFSPDSDLAPSSASRWMASGGMDASGNIAIGYTVSGADNFPSIHAATRLATDPAGILTDEFVLVEGGGSQGNVNRGRWADYASMSIDPVDDCTFWYTNEYYKAENNNSLTWSTYIASFKVPTCTTGPTGRVSGVVTDAESGETISKATVTVGNISTVTDDEGNYSFILPVDDYQVTVSRYGWVQSEAINITVEDDDELTNNFALDALEKVELTGKVTDANQAWPLYAKISASVPGDTIVTYSNPETGDYVLPVFEGTTIQIKTQSMQLNGYQARTQDILPQSDTNSPMALNLTLNAEDSCTAFGYKPIEPFFIERFEGEVFPPEGWTVTDGTGNGIVWDKASSGKGNVTNTEGDAALVDSDAAGRVDVDSSLITKDITVSDISSPMLSFVANYKTYTGADKVDLDISIDGAAWTNVIALNTGVQSYEIDLSTQLEGATSFKLRWRYYDANYEWYTSIDDVTFGEGGCEVLAGSITSGYVVDTNTSERINNADVMINGVSVTHSSDTENDDALDDGFIHFFVPTDAEITLKAINYSVKNVTLDDITLATPVSLDAGQLSTDVDAITLSLRKGITWPVTVTLENIGSADAEYEANLIDGKYILPNGPFHQSTRHMGPKDLQNFDASKIRYFAESLVASNKIVEATRHFDTNITYGWGVSVNRETNEFYIGDLLAVGAPADVIWKYQADGTLTEDKIALDFVGNFHADSAFDTSTGKLWQVNVGGSNCIHEIDVNEQQVTGMTICPEFSTSQRGLAYDPITDTFYSGSWNDSIIHQFKKDGTIVRSINTSLYIAGLAFNANTGHLFASLNTDNYDIVILDANTTELDQLEAIDILFDKDGDGEATNTIQSGAAVDLDCQGNLWVVDQEAQLVVGVPTGEETDCDLTPDWASIEEAAGTLQVNEVATVELSVDTNQEFGDYNASLWIKNSTPYGSKKLPVNLTIREDMYGKFSIANIDVNEADMATVTVTRTDGDDFAVSVDYATVDGTALASDHYTATTGTLTWTDKDTEPKTFTIQTNQLGNIQDDLSFDITLSNAQGGATIETNTASVKIVNIPNGNISIAPVEVNESGIATIVATRADGGNFAISVDYVTVDGTALASDHYTATTGTLTWADKDTEPKTFTIQTNQLGNIQDNLSFQVQLNNAQGGAIIETEAVDMTIVDLPNGTVQFTVTDATIQENGNVTLSVERTDAANFAISVDYTTVNGTGSAGSDYTAKSGTLTWTDQDTATKTITIATGDVSSDKNFSITLSNTQGGANIGANSSVTVNITNKSSGGSIGFYILILLSLMSIYRRKSV